MRMLSAIKPKKYLLSIFGNKRQLTFQVKIAVPPGSNDLTEFSVVDTFDLYQIFTFDKKIKGS